VGGRALLWLRCAEQAVREAGGWGRASRCGPRCSSGRLPPRAPPRWLWVSPVSVPGAAVRHFTRCAQSAPLPPLPTPTDLPHTPSPSFRQRLVWSRIWAVLSEYFISVGCHSNLAVGGGARPLSAGGPPWRVGPGDCAPGSPVAGSFPAGQALRQPRWAPPPAAGRSPGRALPPPPPALRCSRAAAAHRPRPPSPGGHVRCGLAAPAGHEVPGARRAGQLHLPERLPAALRGGDAAEPGAGDPRAHHQVLATATQG
jgi:hypothetical protein